MSGEESQPRLTEKEIQELLAPSKEAEKQRLAADQQDIANVGDDTSVKNLNDEEWVMMAEFSALLMRDEVVSMMKQMASHVEISGVNVFNAFNLKCTQIHWGVDVDHDIVGFLNSVVGFYAGKKRLAEIEQSLNNAIQPLFDFLLDAYREAPRDYLKITLMEQKWKELFSPLFAYHIVKERVESVNG